MGGSYPLPGSPYSVSISGIVGFNGVPLEGESVNISRYDAVPGAYLVSCSCHEVVTEERGLVYPYAAEITHNISIGIPFYLVLHTVVSGSYVSDQIPPINQDDYSPAGDWSPRLTITARDSRGHEWGIGTFSPGPLKSGESKTFGGEYEHFGDLKYCVWGWNCDPLVRYRLMLRNWARGGAASIGYSGFTALIIIPDPEIDPSEYVIPPEWWAESDPDRRRRAAWVAGAGGRFSGALSGEMRGI